MVSQAVFYDAGTKNEIPSDPNTRFCVGSPASTAVVRAGESQSVEGCLTRVFLNESVRGGSNEPGVTIEGWLGLLGNPYRRSGQKVKERILDDFVKVTGYRGKHGTRFFDRVVPQMSGWIREGRPVVAWGTPHPEIRRPAV